MDPAGRGRKRCAAAAPALLDDLGGDRHGGLLRGAATQVQPDRRVQPDQLLVGDEDALQAALDQLLEVGPEAPRPRADQAAVGVAPRIWEGNVAFEYNNQGNVPHLLAGRWDAGNWDITPTPRHRHAATSMGGWSMGIHSQTAHPDEAWMLLDWMLGIEGSIVWQEIAPRVPPRHSTIEAHREELLGNQMRLFVEQAATIGRPTPPTVTGNSDILETFRTLIRNVIEGARLVA